MINFKKYPQEVKFRHHVSSHHYYSADDLTFVPENYAPLYNEINWGDIFKNAKKADFLDIGCGRGHFLADFAFLNPEKNILGIEIRENPINWINTVIEGEKLENCKALFYSVANNLPFIDDNSIEAIFYLFPDPWPKTRHFRRRAFTNKFIEECYRVLKKDGKLYLSTDVEMVHNYQLSLLKKFGKFNLSILPDRDDWHFPLTHKEKFCIEKDIYVHRTICQK